MKDDTFYLTTYHVLLLRCASVRWCDDELGAPGLDPKYPYGDSDLDGSMARAIGLNPNDLSPRIAEGLNRLHRETERALQVVLASRSFEPGTYKQLQPYNSMSWDRVGPLPDGHDALPELHHAQRHMTRKEMNRLGCTPARLQYSLLCIAPGGRGFGQR